MLGILNYLTLFGLIAWSILMLACGYGMRVLIDRWPHHPDVVRDDAQQLLSWLHQEIG